MRSIGCSLFLGFVIVGALVLSTVLLLWLGLTIFAIVDVLVLLGLLTGGLIMWRKRKGMGWSFFLGLVIIGALTLVVLIWLERTNWNLTSDQVINLLEASSEVLLAILLFLGVAVAVAALYRFHMIGLAPDLIIAPIKFASSGNFEENKLLSLTLELREHLVDDLEIIANHVDGSPDLFPHLPLAVRRNIHQYIDRRLEHLESPPDRGPSEQISWVMSLANFLFPRGSIRISCDLVRTSKSLGVSYEMEDPIDQMMPVFGTLYCNEDKDDFSALTSAIDCYREKLLPNVSKVLAIEICKVQMDQMLNHRWYWLRRLGKKDQDKAEMDNFIGFLYLNQTKVHDGFFYNPAIKYFQSAIKEDNKWYMPYVHLALTHSIEGQKIERRPYAEPLALEKALDLQYAAWNEYNSARACIKKDEAEEMRVKIDLARVKLLIGKLLLELNKKNLQEAEEAVNEAKEVIAKVKKVIGTKQNTDKDDIKKARQAIVKVKSNVAKAWLDFDEARQAKPMAQAVDKSLLVIDAKQDVDGALQDFNEALQVIDKSLLVIDAQPVIDKAVQEAQQAVNKALLVIDTKQSIKNAQQAMLKVQQAVDQTKREALQDFDEALQVILQDFDEAQQVIKKGQEQTNVRILYHLACCYGIAYGIAKDQRDEEKANEYQEKTYKFLARSLARNMHIFSKDPFIIDFDPIMDTGSPSNTSKNLSPGGDRTQDSSILEDPNWYYWRRVDSDPDFESIRNDNDSRNDIKTLKEKLRRKLLESPSLGDEPKKMTDIIGTIVEQVMEV